MANSRPSPHLISAAVAAALAALLSGCAGRVSVRERAYPAVAGSSQGKAATAIGRGRIAYESLRGGDFSAENVAAYRAAVAAVIDEARSATGFPGGEFVRLPDESGEISVRLATAPGTPWKLDEIESVQAADGLRIRGFRDRVETPGIGAPLIAEAAGPEGECFAADASYFLPATALLEFPAGAGDDDPAVLTFHDPLRTSSATFLGKPRPLQADFTAPIAATFARRDRQRINLPALIKFEKFQDSLGMHPLDFVHPDRIPVVFVHGLKSNPDTWRDTVNELRRDPVIRERFEFWYFGYATGPPIPFSAMRLRESLEALADYRGESGADTDDVVLVGHSMGGLLAKLMTQSSGDENWFKLFGEPLEALDVSESDRDLLRRMAYFDPVPFVHRVVYVSTPHGGSRIAANPIGRITSALIQVPGALLSLSTGLLEESLTSLTPLGREIARDVPTSIDMLRSDVLTFFRSIPPNPGVAYHSIIGEKDRLVDYQSAHVGEALSEKIVPDAHDAHDHPEAILELARILREHGR